MASLSRRLAAEALGTALLLAVVIGSGIMGERLAGGPNAVALLANTLATGAEAGAMPAKVSLSDLAMVTAGLANDVEAVNQ